MDIKTAEQDTFKEISYRSSEYESLLKEVKTRDTDSYHISIFIGLYQPDKTEAAQRWADQLNLELKTFDFAELVTKSEPKTIENINKLFDGLDASKHLLYFKNGANICGNYTGFTFSKVKYATPQERRFLKLAQEFNGVIIIDMRTRDAVDNTLLRASQSIVRFQLPKSPLKRFAWKLKHYTLHGYKIRETRLE